MRQARSVVAGGSAEVPSYPSAGRASLTTAGALALSQSGSPNTPRGKRSSQQRPVPGATNHTDHGCCLDPHRARILTAIGLSTNGECEATVVPLRCKTYSCRCCGPRLRARNRRRALLGVAEVGPGRDRLWMLTLTLPGVWHRLPDAAVEHGPQREHDGRRGNGRGRLVVGRRAMAVQTFPVAAIYWNRLRTTMKREYGVLPYYRGAELHRSGVVHLHVLLRLPLELVFGRGGRLAELVAAAGFGRYEMTLARSRGDVAEYVTKAVAAYASKDDEEAAFPKWKRRGTWSKDWCDWTPATSLAGFAWQLSRASVALTEEALRASGFRVLDPDSLRVTVAGGPPAGG